MFRVLGAALAIVLVVAALIFFGTTPPAKPVVSSGPAPSPVQNELIVMCAAGLRKPAEACATTFTAATGIQIRFQYGGSGQLISQIVAGAPADVFIPGDSSYIQLGKDKDLIREALPLAEQHPVIAVAAGNPKGITNLESLLKPGVKFAVPNPEAASLGRTLKMGLGDRWAALASAAAVMKPTVPDLLNDLQVGSVDAIIVWDGTVHGVANTVTIEDASLSKLIERSQAAVTKTCSKPAEAIKFLRWMASPEHGNPVWAAHGFKPLPGDAWSAKPTMTLYSGTVNRIAIQASLKEFSEREGCEINTVYNGCGILTATMKQMAQDKLGMPDAYYACDICFVPPVMEHFPEAVILTEANIVIAVPKGNPKNIKTLEDLAKPGLKIGIGNAKQSTLGYMTDVMLETAKIKEAVLVNAVSQVPAGDLLITQLRAGSLDAAIVYNTNAQPQSEFLDTLTLNVPGAKAMQPFSVGKNSAHAQLAGRLLEYLRANKDRFESAGFRWLDNKTSISSSTFSTNPADVHRHDPK